MVRAGPQTATRALALLLAAPSGDGVDRALITVRQDVNRALVPVMEELTQLQHPRPRLLQLKAQLRPQLHLRAVMAPPRISRGQKLDPYPTAASSTAV